MVAEQVPTAVWEGTFKVFRVDVRCYVLDDGRRIMNAEDVERVFAAKGKPVAPDPGELEAMAMWSRGVT
jgi:hypothetical protein